MALKPCRECGQQVSGTAKVCPSCGIKSPARKPVGCGIGTLILFGLFILGSAFISMIGTQPPTPLSQNHLVALHAVCTGLGMMATFAHMSGLN